EASTDSRADAAGASGDERDAALQLVADANGDVVVLGDVENAHVSPLCPRSCGEGRFRGRHHTRCRFRGDRGSQRSCVIRILTLAPMVREWTTHEAGGGRGGGR